MEGRLILSGGINRSFLENESTHQSESHAGHGKGDQGPAQISVQPEPKKDLQTGNTQDINTRIDKNELENQSVVVALKNQPPGGLKVEEDAHDIGDQNGQGVVDSQEDQERINGVGEGRIDEADGQEPEELSPLFGDDHGLRVSVIISNGGPFVKEWPLIEEAHKNLFMIVLKYYNEAKKFRELFKMTSLNELKKGGRDGE